MTELKAVEKAPVVVSDDDKTWLASMNREVDMAMAARQSFIEYLFAKHRVDAKRMNFRTDLMAFVEKDAK